MSSWKKRKSGWTADGHEQEYWLSYSDLMAGLLMIFALMLFAALHHYGGIINEAGQIANTRNAIILKLDSIMKADSSGVVVDPETGAVKFPDGVLFDEGRADLRPEGKRQLDRFADKYFEVLLGDAQVRSELKSIVIEGHTNDNSSYEYNLDLSQRRAFAVMMHLLAQARPPYDSLLKEYVTANGRSFSDLIYCDSAVVYPYPCPHGAVDKVKSRRIEILFRLRDAELLDRIRSRLAIE